MSYFLIILLVIVVLIGVSLALGRTTSEAQSVRDDEFVELDGSWIRYRVVGEGPPVLLVHGFLVSSKIWRALAGALSERFTVYTLDLRGFGESDKPLTGYGVRHGSRLLHAFCQRFGLVNVAVVGHDISGDMVVKLAADHPDLVRSVTAVATPANEEQMDLPTLLWLATLPVIGPLFYALGQYASFVRKLWMKAFVAEGKEAPDEVFEDAASSTPAAVRSTFNTVKREISRERISRQSRNLKAPMLVIAGQEDQIVDPAASETWSRTASRSEVALLEGCGHLPMIEAPAEFNARVMSFMTGDESYLSRARPAEPEPAPQEKTQVVEEPQGIDGMEPDPEASAPDPEEQGPRTSGQRDSGIPPRQEQGDSRQSAGDRRSNGRRRDTAGEDLIPELPDDLFSWSGGRERRSREAPEPPAERESASSGEEEHLSDLRRHERQADSESDSEDMPGREDRR